MQQALVEQVRQGAFGAIVIDTSIFHKYQFGLASGLLRRAEQFADGSVKVLMPDVIRREVEKHLTEKVSTAQTGLLRALRMSRYAGLVDGLEAECGTIESDVSGTSAETASHSQLDAWMQRTGAEIIKCGSFVDVATLMDQFFDAKAPFAPTGDKKSEFPDAVVLLALDAWADANETRVLAVSADKDWNRFSETSDRIHVITDLAEALGAFQDHAVLYYCKLLADSLEQGDPYGILAGVKAAVSQQLINTLQVEIVAHAGNKPWAINRMEAMPLGVRFAEGPTETRFSAVFNSAEMLVTQVRLVVELRFAVAGHVAVRDGEAGEAWPQVVIRKEDVMLDATIAFDGRIPERMRLKEVEILPASYTLNLGDVFRT